MTKKEAAELGIDPMTKSGAAKKALHECAARIKWLRVAQHDLEDLDIQVSPREEPCALNPLTNGLEDAFRHEYKLAFSDCIRSLSDAEIMDG